MNFCFRRPLSTPRNVDSSAHREPQGRAVGADVEEKREHDPMGLGRNRSTPC